MVAIRQERSCEESSLNAGRGWSSRARTVAR